MLRDEKTLLHIVKCSVRKAIKCPNFNDTENPINKVCIFLLYKKGLLGLFNIIKYKYGKKVADNGSLLKLMLNIQESELYAILKMDYRQAILEKEIDDISPLKFLDTAFKNMQPFFSENNGSGLFPEPYQITRIIYVLTHNKLMFDFTDKYEDFIGWFLMPDLHNDNISDERKQKEIQVLIYLLTSAVNSGEELFLECLRKYLSLHKYSLLSEPNNTEFFLLLTWYLSYATQENSLISTKGQVMVNRFLSKPCVIKDNDERAGFIDIWRHATGYNHTLMIDLHKLLKMQETGKNYWLQLPTGVGHSYNISQSPEERSFIKWFFEFIFFTEIFYSTDSIVAFFNHCDDNEKWGIADFLRTEWFDGNNNLKVNNTPQWLIKLGDTRAKMLSNLDMSPSIEELVKWKDEILLTEIKKVIPVVEKASLEEKREKMIKIVNDEMRSHTRFFDDTIDLKNIKIRVISMAGYENNRGNIIYMGSKENTYVDMAAHGFIDRIKFNEIQTVTRKKELLTVDLLKEEDMDKVSRKIDKLKPTLCNGKHYMIFPSFEKQTKPVTISDTTLDILNKCDEIDRKDMLFAPHVCVFIDGAIKYNFAVENDEEHTFMRHFTDDELNQFIDKNYKRADGQYCYTDFGKNIFMTKDAISDLIKTRYFIMQLAFRCNVKIDNKKLIAMKTIYDKE
ncbi:hypothetical protein FACS1894211_02140 [Clostridia bacterium]|nr:hypothetical protein FACS1894211_02140 [Clostridia bacterium]